MLAIKLVCQSAFVRHVFSRSMFQCPISRTAAQPTYATETIGDASVRQQPVVDHGGREMVVVLRVYSWQPLVSVDHATLMRRYILLSFSVCHVPSTIYSRSTAPSMRSNTRKGPHTSHNHRTVTT